MTEVLALPGYVVEQLLGRGASSQVWRARVARSGDVVALKHVRVSSEVRLSSARTEAAMLSVLDHPNLVRMHDFVRVADGAVLVLDYAAGGSLARLLAQRGKLTPGEVITALAPVAAALAHAHEASVVHGDVSAANVLFTAKGVPLLADLGVARLIGDHRPISGTSCYVDPSVAQGAPPAPQSDVFMLGGVALHALTGQPTWRDASDQAALDRARMAAIGDVASRLADAGVGPDMAAVVCRALSVDPRRRGTAAEFALDLRHSAEPIAVELSAGRAAATGSLPPTRHVAPRARPVLPRRPEPSSWRRRTALAGAGVVAVALAGGALAWAPWHSAGRAATPPATVAPSRKPPSRLDPWLAALEALDARRAQAFARRAPALLDGVYADRQLRAEDTATLLRAVPPGCGLVGVATSYANVHVRTASASRAVVTATARLGAGQLICSGTARSSTRPSAPTRLRVELVATPVGIRIAGQSSTT